MPAIVLLSAWATFPFQMLIYLAGLQEIPRELYEAAQLDGANAWQRFLHVTLPGLRNTNIFVIIVTTVGAIVITSYSIHYTKLYDQIADGMAAEQDLDRGPALAIDRPDQPLGDEALEVVAQIV